MPLLELGGPSFLSSYNRLPFKLQHNLCTHPLFAMPELRALILRAPKPEVLHRAAVVPPTANFETAHVEHPLSLTLEETFDRLAEVPGYIVVNYPERDPMFRALCEDVLSEIRRAIDPVDPGLYWFATYLFVSSGGSVTPYHMDREMNFLLQVRGTKQVSLWDPADRAVMTELERERLFTDFTANRPHWRETHRERELHFEIGPGDGVHHPFIAPHIVVNGTEPSVSWAITFRTPGSDAKGDVHKVNHYLRRLGLHPKPQGSSPLRDRAKALAARVFKSARERVKPTHDRTSPVDIAPPG